VLQVERLQVECGTNVRYARVHQRGLKQRFELDEGQLQRNVTQSFGGRPAARTPTGRRSRATRRWNPMYFQARNWLRKLHGKSFRVPKREIIRKPTKARLRSYVGLLKKAILSPLGR